MSDKPSPYSLSRERLQEIESRWQAAVKFYRARGSVLFVSYCRFWEKHAFVQQSLARTLVDAGIPVTWLDGAGWRPYRPTLYWESSKLTVKQIPALPGRRLETLDKLNLEMQANVLRARVSQMRNPLVWVQAGIEDKLAERLPYIDVFSTFDDPYFNAAAGALCSKAKIIVAQNSFTLKQLAGVAGKTELSLPPVDISRNTFPSQRMFPLPPRFPERRMGYVGSMFSADFDFVKAESFLRGLPDWGFVFVGRTDGEGSRALQSFAKYPNFVYHPWVPRADVAAAWRLLNCCLLLYRPQRSQDGAFPTKILESLYFGVPCVATRVRKTDDLEGWIPRHSFPEALQGLAVSAAQSPAPQISQLYEHFAYEMNPKLHLARVAERLTR